MSLRGDWIQRAEDQVKETADLTTDEAMRIIESWYGPGYLTREEFERYRYILDRWDSGLEPEGRWEKGYVRLTEPEYKILLLFRNIDLPSPGGIQALTGVQRETQATWALRGHVRAFMVRKGEAYTSLTDIKKRLTESVAAGRMDPLKRPVSQEP